MGRRYAQELEELEQTYAWALSVDIAPLRAALANAAHLPIVAVGSGGATTAALILAYLHRQYSNQMSVATTPFLLASHLPHRARVSTWLVSAGGRNKDIRGALRLAIEREPRHLCLMCGAPGSALVREAEPHAWIDSWSKSIPFRDGFLAVNSSLGFAVLLSRAFREARHEPPDRLQTLLAATYPRCARLSDTVAGFWAKKTLVVLHGAATHAAALDLESRFTEAALGTVQIADYRNFGHGRHHWIAKHGESTAVLSLVGPGDESLSRSTLRVLPRNLLSRELTFAGDSRDVAVASLFASIQLAGLAGIARGIDPGRPGVPAFGSKLYSLAPSRRPLSLNDARRAAIVRKSGASPLSLEATEKFPIYDKALAEFEQHLSEARFGGVVLDYDGTLRCGPDRNASPTGPAASALARLATAGLMVGIATGRGDSVVEPLRQLFAKRLWPKIIVGYHNGATVAALADAPPSSLAPMAPELAAAKDAIEALGSRLPLKLRAHPRQLTVFATSPLEEGHFWSSIAEALARADLRGLTVLRSSHSVDVLPPGVSKLRVVEAISSRLNGTAVLCIGDRGRWPGNDYELLANSYSLSVDEVSDDLSTGWNLAPPGVRGDAALAFYLERLQRSSRTKSWRFLLK